MGGIQYKSSRSYFGDSRQLSFNQFSNTACACAIVVSIKGDFYQYFTPRILLVIILMSLSFDLQYDSS